MPVGIMLSVQSFWTLFCVSERGSGTLRRQKRPNCSSCARRWGRRRRACPSFPPTWPSTSCSTTDVSTLRVSAVKSGKFRGKKLQFFVVVCLISGPITFKLRFATYKKSSGGMKYWFWGFQIIVNFAFKLTIGYLTNFCCFKILCVFKRKKIPIYIFLIIHKNAKNTFQNSTKNFFHQNTQLVGLLLFFKCIFNANLLS